MTIYPGFEPQSTPIDNYPHAPIAPLTPSDPDPEPISPQPLASSTPFIPAATLRFYFDVAVTRRIVCRVLPAPTGTLTPSTFTIRRSARVKVFEQMNVQVRRRVIMEQVPLLTASVRRRVIFTDGSGDFGLFARYPFNLSTTDDNYGTYDLDDPYATDGDSYTEALQLVYDADIDDYCIQFADYATAPTYLRLDPGTPFSMFGSTQNWSWKVTFEVNFWQNPDRYAPDHYGTLFQIVNQINIYTTTESICVNEEWYDNEGNIVPAGDPSAVYSYCLEYASTEPTLHFEIDPYSGEGLPEIAHPTTMSRDTWHAVEVEYNAALHRMILRVDGVAETLDIPLGVAFNNNQSADEVIVGAMGAETRMRNLKVYKIALVDHPPEWD